VGMYLFWSSSDTFFTWVNRQLHIEPWLQKERNEWLSFLFVMSGMMLHLMIVLFYFSFFKYLVLIIGSPLFAFLSEKTEANLEEKEHRINWADLKRDCSRSIKLALRNCGWQAVYLVALLLVCLIPVVGWITPLIALGMECYYYGFSMQDYSLARTGLNTQQSIYYSSRHKGLAIANGFVFYIMHLLIPLAPAFAVIAATLAVHKAKNN
jgi:CysZ protein